MLSWIQPNFAPEGASHGSTARQHELHPTGAEAVRAARHAERVAAKSGDCETAYHNEEGYDEGLVHSHGWAASH